MKKLLTDKQTALIKRKFPMKPSGVEDLKTNAENSQTQVLKY